MMYRIFTVALLLMLLVSACRKNDEVLFPMPLTPVVFEIPPTASPFLVHYFNVDNVPTNGTALFANAGVSTNAEEVTVVPGEAFITSLFAGINYDFIQAMSLRICDQGDHSQNCGVEIFWRQPVPLEVGGTLDLVPSNVDVKPYLLKEKVNIQVKLEMMRENPPQFVESRLEIRFDAK